MEEVYLEPTKVEKEKNFREVGQKLLILFSLLDWKKRDKIKLYFEPLWEWIKKKACDVASDKRMSFRKGIKHLCRALESTLEMLEDRGSIPEQRRELGDKIEKKVETYLEKTLRIEPVKPRVSSEIDFVYSAEYISEKKDLRLENVMVISYWQNMMRRQKLAVQRKVLFHLR